MTTAARHTHCPICNSDRTEIRYDRTRRLRYLKKDWILEGLEHTVCLGCGASFNAPGQIARNNERFAAFEAATVKGIAPRQIIALREKYMISQEEAARIFHTGKTAFSKWERGEVAPTGPTALLLQEALEHDGLMRRLAAKAKVAITATFQLKVSSVVIGNASIEALRVDPHMDNQVIMAMWQSELVDQRFQQLADEMDPGDFATMSSEQWRKALPERDAMWSLQ